MFEIKNTEDQVHRRYKPPFFLKITVYFENLTCKFIVYSKKKN